MINGQLWKKMNNKDKYPVAQLEKDTVKKVNGQSLKGKQGCNHQRQNYNMIPGRNHATFEGVTKDVGVVIALRTDKENKKIYFSIFT